MVPAGAPQAGHVIVSTSGGMRAVPLKADGVSLDWPAIWAVLGDVGFVIVELQTAAVGQTVTSPESANLTLPNGFVFQIAVTATRVS